jgi:UDP-4-keto-D-QuiNAc 4-reductase
MAKSTKQMKVLVTGANGFLGSSLCKQLTRNVGIQVIGAVRSANGRVVLPTGISPIEVGNINDKTDWTKALKDIDVVVHLAARVHVMSDTNHDPLSAFREVNTRGTAHLANSVVKSGIRKIVFISSIKVNGEGESTVYSEESTPSPHDPYAQSKWEAEQILHQIARETGLEVVIIRSPLVYGPGVEANFLRLLKWVERGIPLPLGAVRNKRSMIYLGNLVDAVITCLNHEKAAGQTFLVSDGQDMSTPELIKMIANGMGKKTRLLPLHVSILKILGNALGKSSEIDRLVGSLCIDSRHIRNTLNWSPPFSMEEGIRETAEWFLQTNF